MVTAPLVEPSAIPCHNGRLLVLGLDCSRQAWARGTNATATLACSASARASTTDAGELGNELQDRICLQRYAAFTARGGPPTTILLQERSPQSRTCSEASAAAGARWGRGRSCACSLGDQGPHPRSFRSMAGANAPCQDPHLCPRVAGSAAFSTERILWGSHMAHRFFLI
jgi:hypothetical protein